MSNLLVLGLGFSAEHYLALDAARWTRVTATVRDADRAAMLDAATPGPLNVVPFDGSLVSSALAEAVARADALLVSAPPGEAGDSLLTCCGEALAASGQLRDVVYLSTLGVYGNYDGAWVDETSECRARDGRTRRRYEAEQAWLAFGQRTGAVVTILRLAGIYGPGRSALDNVRAGTARIIDKPGQVFNRIHVDDIAQAIKAALDRRVGGIFNVCDDEPTPPGDPVVYAATLLGVAPPPAIPFETAKPSMSPMAASFYADCRRVRNERLKSVLGVTLRYPTYREGLDAIRRSS
ncbi:NAD-dependent epimerase/dehydratase family protein [Undibacter mobilis]|uniref:NAD-dependent epimerase/dehydratase family protein n=1 Tax=Undibacter mobilis TaxID=2292256 RepID=A0A371B718_9BRAD|nr:NAD-dependent epimerase/dehydratase family protein [Undibacter mobilis]RDV03370.1 NAD-dependent epimerase/dehydratase family protein [Undibacter mobilis]